MEFEPTASQPEIERAPEDLPVPVEQNEESTASALLNRYRTEIALIWISPIVALFVLAFLYFVFIERWLYMRLSPAAAIERIYRRFYRLGRPLTGERTQGETAYEFAIRLVEKLQEIMQRSLFTKLFAKAQNDIELLTNLYYVSLFSQNQTQKNDAIRAVNIWKQLRLRLIVAWATERLNKTS